MDQPPVLTVSGRIATVTLTRPDVANRMNPSDLRVFADHIEAVNEMKSVISSFSLEIAEKILKEHLSDNKKQKDLVSNYLENIKLN